MKLPELTIDDLTVSVPIVQGGMGVGISLASLSGNVAKEGGIGIISAAQIGFKRADFFDHPIKANLAQIPLELEKARKIAPNGVLGFNIMVATNRYEEYVQAAIKAGADVIISGAGLPLKLPALAQNSKTKIAPVISSAKAAKILLHYWEKHFDLTADFIIVESPAAGGHLGFSYDEAEMPLADFDQELPKILKIVARFRDKYQKSIPVLFAGGVYDQKDILHYLALGCSGVQMASRFVTTKECDAPASFKEAYLNATAEDIQIIKSPVGMPGRAIHNPFTEKIKSGPIPPQHCYQCLSRKHCDRKTIPFCISKSLIDSASGDAQNGLVFAGSTVARLKEMTTVHELMKELTE